MIPVRIAYPKSEPVPLLELKEYLRLDHNDEDGLLERLIRAAREDFERSTDIILIEQTWEIVLTKLSKDKILSLGVHPIRKINVKVFDKQDDSYRILEPVFYTVDKTTQPNTLSIHTNINASKKFIIEFTAGFVETAEEIPGDIQQAIMLLAAHWYEFRSGFFSDGQKSGYPLFYERIVNNYRMRRL